MYKSRILPLFLLLLVALCTSHVTLPFNEGGKNITTRVCPESCICFNEDHAVCKSIYKEGRPISEQINTLELDGLSIVQIGAYLKNADHVKHLIINQIEKTNQSNLPESTSLTSLDNLRSMTVKDDYSNYDTDDTLEKLLTIYPQLEYVYLDTEAMYCACASLEFFSKLTNVFSSPFKVMQVVKCASNHHELLRHSYVELKQICESHQHVDENNLSYSASEADDTSKSNKEDNTSTIELVITNLDRRQKRDVALDDLDSELDIRNNELKSAIQKREARKGKRNRNGKRNRKGKRNKKGKRQGRRKKEKKGIVTEQKPLLEENNEIKTAGQTEMVLPEETTSNVEETETKVVEENVKPSRKKKNRRKNRNKKRNRKQRKRNKKQRKRNKKQRKRNKKQRKRNRKGKKSKKAKKIVTEKTKNIDESEPVPENNNEIKTAVTEEAENGGQTEMVIPEETTSNVEETETKVVEENVKPSRKKKNRRKNKNRKRNRKQRKRNKKGKKSKKAKKIVTEKTENIDESEPVPENNNEIKTAVTEEAENGGQTEMVIPEETTNNVEETETKVVEENVKPSRKKKNRRKNKNRKRNRKQRKRNRKGKKSKKAKKIVKEKTKNIDESEPVPENNNEIKTAVTEEAENGGQTEMVIPEETTSNVEETETKVVEENVKPSRKKKNRRKNKNRKRNRKQRKRNRKGKKSKKAKKIVTEKTKNIDESESVPENNNEIKTAVTENAKTSEETAAIDEQENVDLELPQENDLIETPSIIESDITKSVIPEVKEPSVIESPTDLDVDQIGETESGNEAEALVPAEISEKDQIFDITEDTAANKIEATIPEEEQVIISKEMFDEMKQLLSASKIDLPVDINDPYDLGLLLRHLRHHSDLLANIENPAVKQRVLDALNEQPEGANEE
ncbi:uncharacterized protein [Antedon mediterranea]|uniref:uncharacterized protein n=1 Tax=Antedon mediterranea TaxID=105859 RepID=UPI003AF6E8A0